MIVILTLRRREIKSLQNNNKVCRVMLVIVTLRRKEVSDIVVGRITQCGDSDDSDIDSEAEVDKVIAE